VVELVLIVAFWVLFAFWLLLTARVVVELVRTFARGWRPAGGVAVTLETIYTVTDPPVRLVRRIIPTVRIGGVGLDLSIMVLLLVVFILMRLAYPG
jgi:YggT family protein